MKPARSDSNERAASASTKAQTKKSGGVKEADLEGGQQRGQRSSCVASTLKVANMKVANREGNI